MEFLDDAPAELFGPITADGFPAECTTVPARAQWLATWSTRLDFWVPEFEDLQQLQHLYGAAINPEHWQDRKGLVLANTYEGRAPPTTPSAWPWSTSTTAAPTGTPPARAHRRGPGRHHREPRRPPARAAPRPARLSRTTATRPAHHTGGRAAPHPQTHAHTTHPHPHPCLQTRPLTHAHTPDHQRPTPPPNARHSPQGEAPSTPPEQGGHPTSPGGAIPAPPQSVAVCLQS